MTDERAWVTQPDLASRRFGGSVLWANDETFAERENLITPAAPVFHAATFGHKGQVYDGWETRRRRAPGSDEAVLRLGLPGVISGVVVDTAFFTGNYPPECTVWALAVEGYPSTDELRTADWQQIVPRSPLNGDTRNPFDVASDRRFTHLKLEIHPDGGVARLRVHGAPVPDPALLDLSALDLAALENGAAIDSCSNMFYSVPTNLISPGNAQVMGEGWETSRRRDDGNDWVVVRLAAPGTLRLAELDTTHFKGNAPGRATLSVTADGTTWTPVLDRVRLQPDTRHRFPVDAPEATHARLDIYPDGGMARLRLWGAMTETGRSDFVRRFAEVA
ncbi:allantoicase [Actinokineospora pegani]|uniref:allantoicase n=1 Tax=Actinokineospora pegani TaxID=2654637 RepID=UPI0012E99FA2|nr:allantoicase [Actinokineospora pegani]